MLSYQRAEVVYDATVKFCADLLDKRDRTVHQMVQAAGALHRGASLASTARRNPSWMGSHPVTSEQQNETLKGQAIISLNFATTH